MTIVTPSYLCWNPRTIKEADALHAAGYRVRVVFSQGGIEQARRHDALLLERNNWSWAAVGWSPARAGERALYWRATLRYQVARRLCPPASWRLPGVAERGEGRMYSELAALAAAEPADLYIGHYPIGLAAAAHAARRWGAKLGYDAEDLHTAEPPDTPAGRRLAARIRCIEARYLPRCAHVTAVSEGVADELVRRYGIARPLVVRNVFPWADRESMDGLVKDRHGPELSLCWYSQTIGLDRGIQDAIVAAGRLGGPVQIHLRGDLSPAVRHALIHLARRHGVGQCLHFHERVPPTELLSRVGEHDVGLALEPGRDLNNALTLSNKLGQFLVAGLAIAVTDVPGQRQAMASCPNAGVLYPPGDINVLAAALEHWRTDRESLGRAKAAALEAARTEWNWERESRGLVSLVNGSMRAACHGG